jgi:hypothetical protein
MNCNECKNYKPKYQYEFGNYNQCCIETTDIFAIIKTIIPTDQKFYLKYRDIPVVISHLQKIYHEHINNGGDA